MSSILLFSIPPQLAIPSPSPISKDDSEISQRVQYISDPKVSDNKDNAWNGSAAGLSGHYLSDITGCERADE